MDVGGCGWRRDLFTTLSCSFFSDSFWLECTCVDGNHMNGDVEQTKEGF